MLNETKVTMDYVNGMMINLDACATHNFLINLASDLIGTIKSIKWENGQYSDKDKQFACGDALNTINIIEDFSEGIPQCVWIQGLYQKADILYKLVQGCVLNKSVTGMYLFNRMKKEYRIITYALYMFERFKQESLEKCNSENNCNFKYDDYNERFENMFK